MRFNPPPNWQVEPGWVPASGWQPPPEWGEPPYGWQLWLPDEPGLNANVEGAPTEPPPGPKEETGAEPNPEISSSRTARNRWAWATSLNEHPAWVTIGALVGIVGLVLSVVQIIQGMETPPADLEVAAVTIDGQQSMRGTVFGGDSKTNRSIGMTPIELTLQNKGSEPSLITRIDAEIVYFAQLQDCTGASPATETIAVNYQMPIAMNDIEPAQKDLSNEIRFEVKPESADRMVLNLGPRTQPAFETTPMVMAAKIKLVHDGDEILDVGTVSLVTTVGAAITQLDGLESSPSPYARVCAKENLGHLDDMFAIQAMRSSLLDNLRSAYQRASA